MQDFTDRIRLRDARPMKQFGNGCILGYCRGNFDCWCVFLNDNNGKNYILRDVEYFSKLKQYADVFGPQVYDDFIKIYNLTNAFVNPQVFINVEADSLKYGRLASEVEIIFDIIYLAMIAEEDKGHTRLGKRIKALAVYNVLKEGMDCKEAASYMKGMKFFDIERLCEERGL